MGRPRVVGPHKKTGRPSKGARLRLVARLPVDDAEQILAAAAAAGLTVSDFLAGVLTEQLRNGTLTTSAREQPTLLDRAS